MDSACDEFLSRACLAIDKHGTVGRSDGLDLQQHLSQCGTPSYDLVEAVFLTDFLLKIEVLLFQSVLELSDLFVRYVVLNSTANLSRDERQKAHFSFRIR